MSLFRIGKWTARSARPLRAPPHVPGRIALATAIGAASLAAVELARAALGRGGPGADLWGGAAALAAGAVGLALLTLGAERGSRVFAALTLLLGAANLVDYLLAWTLGAEAQLSRATGPMSPGTALSVSIYATALALAGPGERIRATGAGALGGSVTVLGLAALGASAAGARDLYAWNVVAQTPVSHAAGAIALGAGVVVLAWRANAADRRRYGVAISTTIALGLSVSFLLSAMLLTEEGRSQRRLVRSELERLTHTLGVVTEVHAIAVDRMADRWNREEDTPIWRWRADAENHLAQASAFAAFGWIDAEGRAQWATDRGAVPELGREARRSLLRQAHAARSTRLIESVPERGLLAAVVPLDDGGALLALLSVDALVDLSWGGVGGGHDFSLADQRGVLATSRERGIEMGERARIDLRGLDWQLSVAPGATGALGAVPAFTFLAGIALTLLAAFSMALRRTAVERAEALESLSQELEANAAQLMRTNEELLRSNEELGRFATLASHDLQEPLRQITSFSHRLEEKHGASLDDNGRVYLEFISEAAQRARHLIEDLLHYARLDGQAQRLERVDTKAALEAALDQLRDRMEESGARVEAEPLPPVRANPTLLTQVFLNLLGNALKYRSEEPPHIHVGVRDAGAAWEFSVRDNGLGIDPAYHSRIFEIFERLPVGSDDREVPGTGVGLAVCKKVVERLGGRIAVDSAPGRGSTFRFSLPKLHADT